MSLNIIKANPEFTKEMPNDNYLEVAEFFCDTIQGENFIGYPSAFLRLQHCTQNCHWCDTEEVWRYGNPYSFEELFDLMEDANLPNKLLKGQHLVLTGGSPLKQQYQLVKFIEAFMLRYNFKPFIEIENECTIMPNKDMVELVDVWNNSPKLSNSGNLTILRYQPDILKALSQLRNSWFKFVILDRADWLEVEENYIKTKLIDKDRVVLMPVGATRKELEARREKVISIAIENNVRYTPREHVMVWDKKTGV